MKYMYSSVDSTYFLSFPLFPYREYSHSERKQEQNDNMLSLLHTHTHSLLSSSSSVPTKSNQRGRADDIDDANLTIHIRYHGGSAPTERTISPVLL
mmetsp:Transcript_52250/g.58385  ORF Transcript_52250/g.58385 Transcript_52250/m.58385 type:complete len:96 (-) Transcript_52250:30-317(-)